MRSRAFEIFAREPQTVEWATPIQLFRELDYEFHFELDPCATEENAKCERYFTKEDNGLAQDWTPFKSIFVNPPYGRAVAKWIKKAATTAQHGSTVVMLLPARTDTAWWHDYIEGKAEVRFIRGRIRFGDGNNNAPFPSVIVIFHPPASREKG